MRPTRRQFLATAGAIALSPMAARAQEAEPMFGLRTRFTSPVKIRSIELLRDGPRAFVRTTSTDGAVGLSYPTDKVDYLDGMLKEIVIPFFAGKDARDVESLVDGVYTARSNYKLAGLPFWTPVGWVELSLWDLLGKIAKKPVGELLGGVVRREIPVYLSSLRRDTTPEQEVEWLSKRLAETGAKAVKIKVGGRMSRNRDASPGRTERLVPLARKTFGDAITIYADANGSFDAAKGIEVGKLLEAHGAAIYEEPCPFDEYDDQKRVADALTMTVAGGEQDTSWARWKDIVGRRVYDVVQPDLAYNGGFTRAARVARLAEAAKMEMTPHSPATGPNIAYILQYASCAGNLGPFIEFNGHPRAKETWFSPSFEVRDGKLEVPDGPGLGVEIDPKVLAAAKPG